VGEGAAPQLRTFSKNAKVHVACEILSVHEYLEDKADLVLHLTRARSAVPLLNDTFDTNLARRAGREDSTAPPVIAI